MLPVKNRFPHCDFRGGQISQPLVLWLIWVLASTLDPSASEINKALSVTYKLLFILSKNIVPSRSYRYIRDRAYPVTRLPPPIYTKFDVSNGIWVLASTLAHSASEINKALSVTYKLLFILSKNIVPSRSYRYIRDRAFPVTRLPPPIYTKFDVKQRYIWALASALVPSAMELNESPLLPIRCFLSCQKMLFLAEVIAV